MDDIRMVCNAKISSFIICNNYENTYLMPLQMQSCEYVVNHHWRSVRKMLQKEPEVTIHIAYAFQCVNTAECNMSKFDGTKYFFMQCVLDKLLK